MNRMWPNGEKLKHKYVKKLAKNQVIQQKVHDYMYVTDSSI